MAFASSRIGAQEAIIKSCDLCEDDEDVNWFCKDCVQNLCERCKKTHLKTVTCKHHLVVSILEGLIITKNNISNLCQEHDAPFSFFCRPCDKNICTKCLSMKHKKHDFIDIGESQTELHNKLDAVLKEKVREKDKMESNLNQFEQYEQDSVKAMAYNFAALDEKVKYICKTANDHAENMKKAMKEYSNQRIMEVKESKQKLKANKMAYDEEIHNIQTQMKFQTVMTLNQFVITSISKLQHLKPLSFSIPNATSSITVDSFEETLIQSLTKGDVNKNDESGKHRKNELEKRVVRNKLKIVKTLNLKDRFCSSTSICVGPDGFQWIGGSTYLYIFGPGGLHGGRDDLPIAMHRDVACLKSGAAVAYHWNSEIDKFTPTGNIEECRYIEKLEFTHDIHVNENDEIAIGCSSNKEAPISYIAIFSSTGEQLKEIDVTNAQRFCIDSDGNFLTSDGDVLTLYDISGSVLKKTKRKKNFQGGMICDRYGNILGVGFNEKEVHLISADGKIDRRFELSCDKSVNGIGIDKKNDLLVLHVDSKKLMFAKYLK